MSIVLNGYGFDIVYGRDFVNESDSWDQPILRKMAHFELNLTLGNYIFCQRMYHKGLKTQKELEKNLYYFGLNRQGER